MSKKKQYKGLTIKHMVNRLKVRALAYDMFPNYDYSLENIDGISYISELKRLRRTFSHDLCFMIGDTPEIERRLKEIENLMYKKRREEEEREAYLNLSCRRSTRITKHKGSTRSIGCRKSRRGNKSRNKPYDNFQNIKA